MNVGVALPHYGSPGHDPALDRVVEIARECERLGFDSVWMSDHIVFDLSKYGGSADPVGSLEPMSTLSVLATQTDRVRLGTMVLCNEFRHPVQLAKEAATVDVASGGRLELGLGAGWYEPEFARSGIPFPRPGVRLERLGESVDILKGLFEGGPLSYAGDHYRLEEAIARPLPVQRPRPTIWVGGKGDRALRVVAGVADGWNAAWFQDVEAYLERAKVLGDAPVRRSIGQYARGSAGEMVDRLAAFAAVGVEHAVMCFSDVPFGLDDPDDLSRFAQDVLGHVRKLPRPLGSGPSGA
ncbi:MAG: TIGR03619 family F420-dependent LLM class oxidoreductase [Actinomycetota bacterium]